MRTFTASEQERSQIRHRIAEDLRSEPDVVFAYLHGSFLEGRFRDIDIAVMFPDGAEDPARSEARIERRLTVLVGHPVDLRRLNDAPLLFRHSVLSQGELLVSKDPELQEEYQCSTLALYHDFSHHVESYKREALGLGA